MFCSMLYLKILFFNFYSTCCAYFTFVRVSLFLHLIASRLSVKHYVIRNTAHFQFTTLIRLMLNLMEQLFISFEIISPVVTS